jgi:hypothetical protein
LARRLPLEAVARRFEAAAVLAAGLLAVIHPGAAAAILHLRCTNPASGANWSLSVDFERGRVDAMSATITEQWISWHDPQAGFFDLERATGRLELRNASSTGGYFLHYRCRPE